MIRMRNRILVAIQALLIYILPQTRGFSDDLWTAVKENNLNTLSNYVEVLGMNPDAREPDTGRAALHLASEGNSPESFRILAYLLKKKTNPNIRDNGRKTPLYYSVRDDNWRKIPMLLAKGADPVAKYPETSYTGSIMDMMSDVGRALWGKKPAKKNLRTDEFSVLEYALGRYSENGRLETARIFKMLFEFNNRMNEAKLTFRPSKIHEACLIGDRQAFRDLVRKGFAPDGKCLEMTVAGDDPDMASFLLNGGFVDEPHLEYYAALSAKLGSPRCLKFFLDRGAEREETVDLSSSSGESESDEENFRNPYTIVQSPVLGWAVYSGQSECVKIALSAGSRTDCLIQFVRPEGDGSMKVYSLVPFELAEEFGFSVLSAQIRKTEDSRLEQSPDKP